MYWKTLSFIAIAASALIASAPAGAQEDTNYYGYDKSFIDRPDYKKPTNPFAVSGNDFHKNSYRRMLLNSPFGQSSIGLGANATNKIFNTEAYTYMNPDSFKANDATPEETNRYIDQVYAPPPVSKYSVNQGYQTDKDFNQPNPFKTGSESRFSDREANPFGNTFDAGPNNPLAQKDETQPSAQGYNFTHSFNPVYKPKTLQGSENNSPTDTEPRTVDTSQSNF